MATKPDRAALRIGFISTRFAGTDGVSLETEKWAVLFEQMGHTCFYFAGECDRPAERSYVAPEAFFNHPSIQPIQEAAFTLSRRPPDISARVDRLKNLLKEHLHVFARRFELDVVVSENSSAIPMNIPLGLAIAEFIAETGIPTIGMHHDLAWERQRFLRNCVGDYLAAAFPPNLPSIRHAVINSSAASQLAFRFGLPTRLIPNVMDFDNPPMPGDEYTRTVRGDLGLQPGEKFILQPTRIVQRKGIERAVELVSRLRMPACLVISHESGDEGREYEGRVREYAKLLDVPTKFAARQVSQERGRLPDGSKAYTLGDIYPYADLVTYPSEIEGFGNAFLEAIYYRRPIVVNRYPIYDLDIRPKGFRTIEFAGFITEECVAQAQHALENPAWVEEAAALNYEIARQHYSFTVLRGHLQALLGELFT